MSEAVSDLDTIERRASDWLVRRCEGTLPPEEERAFRQWLAADARHPGAYRSIEQVWGDVATLTHLGALAPLDATPARRRSLVPWAVAAALLVVCVAAVVLVQIRMGQSFDTGIAQTRSFDLPDGSEVTLGARSSLRVVFKADRRRIVLSQGEAFFRAAPDASRPFVVETDQARISVVGTQFDVRHGAGAIRVSVLEGAVDVTSNGASQTPSSRHRVAAGQQAEVDGSQVTVLSPPAGAAPVSDAAAWRFGRLVYEDAPLGQLVADANRYYAPGVELADPGLKGLRITAAFRTGEISQTVMVLANALSLSAQRRPNGRIVLSPSAPTS